MSRIFQALRELEKTRANRATEELAGNDGQWRDLLSSLESRPGSYGSSAGEVRSGQAPGNGGPWQGLAASLESRPEIVERAARVACQPRVEERVVALGQYHTSGQEVFRVLCHRLRQVRERRPLRTVLVTSGVPKEGKTVVAVNLAAMLARSSPRVLLVDADLRHPKLPVLGLSPERGLADYLAGRIELSGAIRHVDPLRFYYLSAGHASANPVELLQKPALQEFMNQTAAAFDWVILDSPPVNLFADARRLAMLVDGVLLVVCQDVTPREAAEQSVAALEGAFIVGLVFNASTHSPHDHYDLYSPSPAAGPSENSSASGEPSTGKKNSDD